MADTIKLMKQRVLNMAISGELVEQREEEGTAQETFCEIKQEKERLIKEKKIKNEMVLPEIEADDALFQIPKSWEWVRLGNIVINCDLQRRPISMKERVNMDGEYPYYGASGIIDSINSWTHDGKFVLIGEDGANLISRSTPLAFITTGKIWVNNHAHVLKKTVGLLDEYLTYFINSISLEDYITGTAQPKLNQANLNKIMVPLPPISEQKRIVEKIESLFAIIDQIGERKQHSLNIIENIRKTALQNAIIGQLVEQDENDEPANELLNKIQVEKEQLILSGIAKQPKPLKHPEDNKNGYEIPSCWEWVKLDDVAVINRGASPRPIKAFVTEDEDGVNWIKIGDSIRGKKYIDSVNQKITQEGAKKSIYVSEGDLIMSNSMSFGYAYIMNTDGCIHDGWLSFKVPKKSVDVNWMHYMLNANYDNFEKLAVGTGVRNLNIERVRSLYIGLPPLAEQQRIVEKLDQIMAICDQMEEILDGSREETPAEEKTA